MAVPLQLLGILLAEMPWQLSWNPEYQELKELAGQEKPLQLQKGQLLQ